PHGPRLRANDAGLHVTDLAQLVMSTGTHSGVAAPIPARSSFDPSHTATPSRPARAASRSQVSTTDHRPSASEAVAVTPSPPAGAKRPGPVPTSALAAGSFACQYASRTGASGLPSVAAGAPS